MKKHTTIYLRDNPGFGWGDSSTGYVLTDDPSSNGALKKIIVKKNKLGLDVTIYINEGRRKWADIFIPYHQVKGIVKRL